MKAIKTLILASLIATFCVAGVAVASVTVARYTFQTSSEVKSFVKSSTGNCNRSWDSRGLLRIRAGSDTRLCAFRSGVVADVSDPSPDLEIGAFAAMQPQTPRAKRKRVYVGVGVRFSDSTSYQFRVFPARKFWELIKDPRGGVGPSVIASGTSSKIKNTIGSGNYLLLRAFDKSATTAEVTVKVNNFLLKTMTDSTSIPDGKRTVVMLGSINGNAKDAVAAFDRVSIRVPSPW